MDSGDLPRKQKTEALSLESNSLPSKSSGQETFLYPEDETSKEFVALSTQKKILQTILLDQESKTR